MAPPPPRERISREARGRARASTWAGVGHTRRRTGNSASVPSARYPHKALGGLTTSSQVAWKFSKMSCKPTSLLIVGAQVSNFLVYATHLFRFLHPRVFNITRTHAYECVLHRALHHQGSLPRT